MVTNFVIWIIKWRFLWSNSKSFPDYQHSSIFVATALLSLLSSVELWLKSLTVEKNHEPIRCSISHHLNIDHCEPLPDKPYPAGGINLSRKSVSTTGLCAECLTSCIGLLCHGASGGCLASYFPLFIPYTQGGCETSYFPELILYICVRPLCVLSPPFLHTGWMWNILLPSTHSLNTG